MTRDELVDKVRLRLCCPSGVCGKGDGPYATCQAHTYDKEARLAVDVTLAPFVEEFKKIERRVKKTNIPECEYQTGIGRAYEECAELLRRAMSDAK